MPEANRKDAIDADTVREAARLAGRKQAKNWNFTLANARQSGYLDGAGSGKFKINSVGENLISMALPDNAPQSSPNQKAKKKRVTKKKTETKKQRKPGA